MEIKYEAVFGPQELFDGASDDAVLAIKDTTSGRIHIFTNYGWIKSGLKHERHIGTSDNQIAMRRIIRTPTDVNTYSESKFEDELEAIYWHFDSQRKAGSLSERDVFKGKVRYLFNQFMQPTKTPTWSSADQKAGKLPVVGCRVNFCHKSNTNWRTGEIKYIDDQVVVIKTNNIARPFVYEVDRVEFKPIESPEEKAARLREEWVDNATFMTTYEIYDKLLSGDLPVPVKGE